MTPQAKIATRLGAGAAAALIAFVGGKEGLRLETYLDYGGIPTACFGETKGIKVGMKFTKDECYEKLNATIFMSMTQVETCVHRNLPTHVLAAFSSFAYNVGAVKFCNSAMAMYAKKGQYDLACREFMRWTFIGGKDCKIRSNLCNGIVIRRQEEQSLCEGNYG